MIYYIQMNLPYQGWLTREYKGCWVDDLPAAMAKVEALRLEEPAVEHRIIGVSEIHYPPAPGLWRLERA